jgi:hypothetical protein
VDEWMAGEVGAVLGHHWLGELAVGGIDGCTVVAAFFSGK